VRWRRRPRPGRRRGRPGPPGEHRGQGLQRRGEARSQLVGGGAHDLEVLGQGAGRHAQADPTGEGGRQPGHLLGHQRRGAQQEEQGTGRGPSGGHGVEEPAGELEGVGQVAGEAAVVLAGHDPVPPVGGGQRGLPAELVHDDRRRGVAAGVEAQRHGAPSQGSERHGGATVRSAVGSHTRHGAGGSAPPRSSRRGKPPDRHVATTRASTDLIKSIRRCRQLSGWRHRRELGTTDDRDMSFAVLLQQSPAHDHTSPVASAVGFTRSERRSP